MSVMLFDAYNYRKEKKIETEKAMVVIGQFLILELKKYYWRFKCGNTAKLSVLSFMGI